ncbi:MAG: MarR family transcriptional regulator [Ramlibacter sp.]|nr:MarR family transcriptional regulator [Ramlibacter sp.]
MNALDLCLQRSADHARIQLLLDDVLGTHHGFSWSDFRLLQALAQGEGGRLPIAELVALLGVQQSGVIRHLIPLEKTGQVQRETIAGRRWVTLRPAGRAQLREAALTAEATCAEFAGLATT